MTTRKRRPSDTYMHRIACHEISDPEDPEVLVRRPRAIHNPPPTTYARKVCSNERSAWCEIRTRNAPGLEQTLSHVPSGKHACGD